MALGCSLIVYPMKISAIVFSSLTLFLTACQSGDIGKRADHSDASYTPTNAQLSERVKDMQKLNPDLSQEGAEALATQEIIAERKKEQKKLKERQAQEKFEKDLAKSVQP